jgi:hypothetical protein
MAARLASRSRMRTSTMLLPIRRLLTKHFRKQSSEPTLDARTNPDTIYLQREVLMKSKQDIRKQLEADMAVFLSSGGKITKVDVQKPRVSRSGQPKEKVVEIVVDDLPVALQKKYFNE